MGEAESHYVSKDDEYFKDTIELRNSGILCSFNDIMFVCFVMEEKAVCTFMSGEQSVSVERGLCCKHEVLCTANLGKMLHSSADEELYILIT